MEQAGRQLSNSLQVNAIDKMLDGGGEMGALMRSVDWSKTPLGAIETWQQSLLTAVSICLFSRFPIHIWWGPEFAELYNDAYRPILGAKHPQSMGQAGQVTWSEIWHIIGPMVESVYHEGKSTWSQDQMLPMYRYGYTEECYFTFSYSPIYVETGSVGGIFTVVTETTREVLSERRLKTLYNLRTSTSEARTVQAVCQIAVSTFAANTADIPFALIYLLDDTGSQAYLAGSSGIEGASDLNLPHIEILAEGGTTWLLNQVLSTGQRVMLNPLADHFSTIPAGPYPEAPHTALVLPILSSDGTRPTGFLIAGVSARLELDHEYESFYELLAGHVATSIASARSYEEERRRAEALVELDRAKTEFFSNVSHEFRTPLTLMINPLQDMLAGMDGTLTAGLRENLETAHRNSLRLLKLVNTLLDFARIQSNRIQASFEPVDLAALTADLASNFRSAAERSKLRFVVDCAPLTEPVYIDLDMWEKIVLNLLSNAFKFTFEGEITVSLRGIAGHAQLIVRDTGIGISAEELPHIFERFHRVHGVRSRTHEGSGIGLALVEELVKLHAGKIEAVSQPEKGTAFTITIATGTAHLPAEQIRQPRTLASTASGAVPYVTEVLSWLENDQERIIGEAIKSLESNLDTGTFLPVQVAPVSDALILVVDDNADMRGYLRRLLEKRYKVETATDGLDALALIRQHVPNLVVADVMMPGLDGFGLVEQLRADPATRALPIILLSARSDESARIEGLQAGADDYLTKPFSARELVARVDAGLQLASMRLEVALNEQETREAIEDIIESIADPFYALDLEWRFVYVNARARAMWGYEAKDLIGRNIWDVFPMGRTTASYVEMQRAVSEQRPVAFETFSAFLDTSVEINIYPSRRGLTVYFRDIGVRKTAERLRDRLELVVSNYDGGFILFDQNWRYIYANHEAGEIAHRIKGISREGLLEMTLEEAFPELMGSNIYRQLKRCMVEQAYAIFEEYVEPYDTWFEYRIYPSEGNLAVFTIDITERKRMEAERTRLNLLVETERERLTNIIAAIPGIIWENHLSAESELLKLSFISAYVQTLLGYTVDEALSELAFWRTVIHPDDRRKFTGAVKKVFQSRSAGVVNLRAIHKNGSRIDLETRMTIMADSELPHGIRGVTMDVSERQRAARSQERYARMLRQSNEELRQFASVVSHDLQEPLRMVTSYMQLLESRYAAQLDADAREFIGFAVDGVARMKELITDLLTYARIERDEKVFEEADIQHVLNNVLFNLALQIEDSGAIITQSVLPRIQADAGQIMQLLQNLISNAIKFQQNRVPRIHIAAERKEGEWQFSVQDNGIGIEQEYLEHIFIMFRRLHQRSEYPGTGIGLAICKKVVERHGGRMRVESIPGQGTTFYFTIPDYAAVN